MAKFGTTKACQIARWYLKVPSHFSGFIFSSLGMHISIVPDSLQAIRAAIEATIRRPPRNSSKQPKAHRKQAPPFTVTACSCTTFWEYCTKLLQWHFRIGTKSYPLHNSLFQISHIPNFSLPGSAKGSQDQLAHVVSVNGCPAYSTL